MNFDYEWNRIFEQLNSLKSETDAEINAVKSEFPVFEEMERCPTGKLMSPEHYDSFSDIEKIYNQIFDEAEKVCERNFVRYQNNAIIRQKLSFIFNTYKIPVLETYYKSSRSSRTSTRNLLNTIFAKIPVINNTLEDQKKSLQATKQTYFAKLSAFKSQKEWKVKQELIEKERQQEKIKKERELALLFVKYNVSLDSSTEDLLDTILSKDKYLELAYWLEKNRGDWNDGPSYAEIGLDKFRSYEMNEIDKEIANAINDHIVNWQDDGRVFRDCEWNYSRIRGLVKDENLVKDLFIVWGNI